MDICVLPHITHQYGTRSELVVAEYLVDRGFYVFSPVVHQPGPIDLIAINENGNLFFIDVKTAGLRTKPNRKNPELRYRVRTALQKKLEVRLAYVGRDNSVLFVPSLDLGDLTKKED
tara:strand:- start:219 stop:569 length:351 start_codon:yes stop_codon:yes gene_type:complete